MYEPGPCGKSSGPSNVTTPRTKDKRQPKLPFSSCEDRSLQRLDRRGLLALRAVLDLELHLLVLLQGLEARALDFGEVREEVFAAAIGLDEAETLGVVEPLDGAGAHCNSFRDIPRHSPGERGQRTKGTARLCLPCPFTAGPIIRGWPSHTLSRDCLP